MVWDEADLLLTGGYERDTQTHPGRTARGRPRAQLCDGRREAGPRRPTRSRACRATCAAAAEQGAAA